MNVRKAKYEDVDQIVALNKKNLAYLWNKQNYEYEIDLDISEFYVLEDQGKILAFVLAHVLFEDLDLLMIIVDQKIQRKGIGTFLIQYLEFIALTKKMKRIILEVNEQDTGVIDFYWRNNFKIYQQRPDYYGKGKHALLMEKEVRSNGKENNLSD